MKKNDQYKNHRYVVYLEDFDRTKKGIHFKSVHRIKGSKDSVVVISPRKAHIIPNMNIFDTQDAAEKYLSGLGALCWVVCERSVGSRLSRRQSIPSMFQGRVLRYVYDGRWRRERKIVVQTVDGELIQDIDMYGMTTYETKKDAESDFSKRWTGNMAEARKQIRDWTNLVILLRKNPPRSREKRAASSG